MKSLLALAFAASLAFAQTAAAEPPSLSAGRRIASTQCGRCHAIDPQGDSLNPRAPRFRDLGQRYPLNELRDAMMNGMIIGHPALMPVIKLNPTEIDDLIAYMKSLQPRSADGRARGSLLPAG